MLEMGINIIEWPSLQYSKMSAFRGDALQRKAMLHRSSFIIIDDTYVSHVVIYLFCCFHRSLKIKTDGCNLK